MMKKLLCFALALILLLSFASCTNGEKPESPAIDFSSMSYVAIGDSTTWGWSPTHPPQYENGGYPKTTANLLGISDITNYGKARISVSKMIEAIPSMKKGASIVSFMSGLDDFLYNVPIGHPSDKEGYTFYGKLNLFTEELLKHYPDAFIFYMTPFPTDKPANSNGHKLEDYAAAIIVVASRNGIPVLDLFSKSGFEKEWNTYGVEKTYPTPEFFEKYTAPQIAEFIRQNYKKRS